MLIGDKCLCSNTPSNSVFVDNIGHTLEALYRGHQQVSESASLAPSPRNIKQTNDIWFRMTRLWRTLLYLTKTFTVETSIYYSVTWHAPHHYWQCEAITMSLCCMVLYSQMNPIMTMQSWLLSSVGTSNCRGRQVFLGHNGQIIGRFSITFNVTNFRYVFRRSINT